MLAPVPVLGDEAVQLLDEIAGVVKTRDLIDEGAGLKFLQIADIIHCDGHVVSQDGQVGQIFFPEEPVVFHIDHFKNADNLSPDYQGLGNDGPGVEVGN